jgi:hypothetical protein
MPGKAENGDEIVEGFQTAALQRRTAPAERFSTSG